MTGAVTSLVSSPTSFQQYICCPTDNCNGGEPAVGCCKAQLRFPNPCMPEMFSPWRCFVNHGAIDQVLRGVKRK
jgi:hypothetical protein